MRAEERTNIQNSIGRLVISALSFLIQISWLCFIGIKLKNYSLAINLCISLIALILAIWVFNRRDTNSNFKMPWILLILAFPILGICLFVVFGHKYSMKVRMKMEQLHKDCAEVISEDKKTFDTFEIADMGVLNQFRYLMDVEGFPVYQETDIEFYGEASEAYSKLIEDVEGAHSFIYLEYFAVQCSTAFMKLYKVLLKKISEGVEVRLLYDDVGSIGFVNDNFAKRLEEKGIRCRSFNKVSPAFRLYMNNRDHRKIAVIDGKVAYTGGFNIADEYFNITHPYGHWKDTGVRLEGKAVNSLLCMFLEMWNSTEKEIEDIGRYKNIDHCHMKADGFVLPYADSPLDDSRIGENVYMNLITNAKESVFITTPYLVISDEMLRTLQMAAQRGVDVRIVTPGIPDKKVTYKLTRSYYYALMSHGVKIYEYTPGFIHCKQVVADGELAIVGTINLDYRSLFLHFENAVLMYRTKAVEQIKEDFINLFEISKQVNPKDYSKNTWGKRITGAVLRLIAPLI